MKENPTLDLYAPKIKLAGDKTEVLVKSTSRGHTVDWTIRAVREDGRWYLMGWEY